MAQVSVAGNHLAFDPFWEWLRRPETQWCMVFMMNSRCWVAYPMRVMVLGKHEGP